METHSTDEDVMRVFVPAVIGDHNAIFRPPPGSASGPPPPERPDLRTSSPKAIGEE